MSPDSEFPRIVLIKSFGSECVKDIKSKLGRYTHIQSCNGVFLDGMDIRDITAIFQSMRSLTTVSLMVRYMHSSQSATTTQRKTVTPIRKPEAPRLDPLMGEELPIPLYILGDIHSHCKKLFELLKEEAASPVSDSSSSSDATGAVTTPMSEINTQILITAEQSGAERNSQEERADSVVSQRGITRGGSNLAGQPLHKRGRVWCHAYIYKLYCCSQECSPIISHHVTSNTGGAIPNEWADQPGARSTVPSTRSGQPGARSSLVQFYTCRVTTSVA